MSVSGAEFTAWLAKPSARRCLLAEIRHSAARCTPRIWATSPARPTRPPISRIRPFGRCAHAVRVTAGDERSGSLDLYNDGTLDDELTRAYPGWPLLYLGGPSGQKRFSPRPGRDGQ